MNTDESKWFFGFIGLPKEMSKDGRSYFWHTDQQFKAIPSMGSLLHAKVGHIWNHPRLNLEVFDMVWDNLVMS